MRASPPPTGACVPEGDSYARHALRLQTLLAGERLSRIDGAGAIRNRSGRLLDSTIEAVRSVGKHLLIDFDSGWSIHVHLGMSGRWEFQDGPDTNAARRTPSLLLGTSKGTARCHDAPTVEVDRTPALERRIRHLGPDLLASPDIGAILTRWRSLPPDTQACDALLDQRVMAGIGNVYKNELLFLHGIHPLAEVAKIGDGEVEALVARAQRLLEHNARRSGPRNTGAGAGSWVYERSGRPCRRCGSPIESAFLGTKPRVTYWCPRCQPEKVPGIGEERSAETAS